jgi:type II secretory pathway pseudopilin PulG
MVMNAGHTTAHGRQEGFSLIWVIAVIVIIGALAGTVMNMFTTARKNEMMLTFDTQARLLAESGMNYASNYASNILTGVTNTPLSTLNGSVTTAGLPSGQQIALTVTVTGGNPYDYNVTSVGTVNQGTNFEANYAVTNLINAPTSGTGVYIVQSKPGTAVASPTAVAVNASALNDYTAGISFDPRFAGSGHSLGSSNFNNGVGSLLNGVRIYFTYSISSGSNADGFVLAIKNGTWNTPYNAGGPPAGTSHGSFLGYAGQGYPYWGNGLGIRPPKIGVEFDIYTNSGHSGGVSSDGRNDPDNHHIANIFWGSTWNITTSPPTNAYSTSSYYGWDDNVHSFGGANDKVDPMPYNPGSGNNDPGGSGLPGLLSINRTTMVGTASPVPVRIELVRPSSVVSTNSSNARYNMYAYVIKTWYNCTNAACSDISVDYNATTPTIQYTVYLTSAMHTAFQSFVYGYQVSTGASTGQYNFSIPRIGMR